MQAKGPHYSRRYAAICAGVSRRKRAALLNRMSRFWSGVRYGSASMTLIAADGFRPVYLVGAEQDALAEAGGGQAAEIFPDVGTRLRIDDDSGIHIGVSGT